MNNQDLEALMLQMSTWPYHHADEKEKRMTERVDASIAKAEAELSRERAYAKLVKDLGDALKK